MPKKTRKSRFWSDKPVGICTEKEPTVGVIDNNSATYATAAHAHDNVLPVKECDWVDKCERIQPQFLDDYLDDVVTFLEKEYVEDSTGNLRLCYSKGLLRWYLENGYATMLCRPYKNDQRGGDRCEIIGFVGAKPKSIFLNGKRTIVADVNFLCVENYYRDGKLATALIQRITGILNKQEIYIAIFTSGKILETAPFYSTKYFHKILNPEKLVASGFTQSADLAYIKNNCTHIPVKEKWQDRNELVVWRYAKKTDVEAIIALQEKEEPGMVCERLSSKEFCDMLLCDDFKVYIIESVCTGNTGNRSVVGSIIFFSLKAKTEKDYVNTLYLYKVAGERKYLDYAIPQMFTLYQDNKEYDMVNVIATGRNVEVVTGQNMLPGTAGLHYYMYNYRLPVLNSSQISYVAV